MGGGDGGWQWPSDSAPEGAEGAGGGWRVDVEVVEVVGGERDVKWVDPGGMVCRSEVWEVTRRKRRRRGCGGSDGNCRVHREIERKGGRSQGGMRVGVGCRESGMRKEWDGRKGWRCWRRTGNGGVEGGEMIGYVSGPTYGAVVGVDEGVDDTGGA